MLVDKDLSSCQESTPNNSGDKSSESSAVASFNNNDGSNENDPRCAIETDESTNSDSVDSFQLFETALEEAPDQQSLRASDSDNSLGHNSTDEVVPVESQLTKKVRNWALEYNISHNALT